MKKLLLSLLIVSLVQNNFAMQSGGSAADNMAGENSSLIYQRLITAIKNGNEEDVLNELIASGDKASKLINARNKDGSTPLIFASRNGREQIVDLLISNNADVNTRTDDGETALCAAVSSRKCTINLVKQLIAANAD
jgi:ankyrin repeat protein